MPQQFERHSRSRWEWGKPPGRADEVRLAASDDPDPAKRPPGRKDTRTWCKGKQGRAHTPALIPDPWPWRHGCAWYPSWTVAGTANWSCQHREVCTACGKVLRHRISDSECPAYPGDPAQKAEAVRKSSAPRFSYRRRRVITGPQGYRKKKAAKT